MDHLTFFASWKIIKKNPNTVASFLIEYISKKLQDNLEITDIILLSDAAGGQNKNIIIVSVCMWLSRMFNVTITHLFPVRGHSFGQCDRNFGIIKSAIKKEETVPTAKKYLEAMVCCRKNPSPFVVTMDKTLIKSWSDALSPLFMKRPCSKGQTFAIQKYVLLKYKPDGSLLASSTYTEVFIPFSFWNKKYNVNLLKNITAKEVSSPGVSSQKEKDVRDLLQYLEEEDRNWIENILDEKNTTEKSEEEGNESSESGSSQ